MIVVGNALSLPFADKTVQCCVTSPPYYGLRDYGVDGQIGLEKTPEEYVSKLVCVFREVKRILKNDGTLWLNLGDSYVNNPGNGRGGEGGIRLTGNAPHRSGSDKSGIAGIKQKDLIGIPWMVAFALRADGWYLRSDIIWHKPNPMPESVKDRPTKAHEYLFLLSKSTKYYYDAEAIFEPANYDGRKDTLFKGSLKYDDETLVRVGGERWPHKMPPIGGIKAPGKNGNPTYSGNTPEYHKIRGFKTKDQLPDNQHHGADINNSRTGSNIVGHSGNYNANGQPNMSFDENGIPARNKRTVWTINTQPFKDAHFAVMPEKLVEPCVMAGSKPGDYILDPFSGAGTVEVVSQKLGRKFVGTELNIKYAIIHRKRIMATPNSLF
jgi:DNA modification methylase